MSEPTTQTMLNALEAFGYGLGGGVVGEVFTLWKIRSVKKEELPHWLKSFSYWIPTLLMIVVGGFLTFLYVKSGSNMSPLIAVHVGASAPIIVGSLVSKNPEVI